MSGRALEEGSKFPSEPTCNDPTTIPTVTQMDSRITRHPHQAPNTNTAWRTVSPVPEHEDLCLNATHSTAVDREGGEEEEEPTRVLSPVQQLKETPPPPPSLPNDSVPLPKKELDSKTHSTIVWEKKSYNAPDIELWNEPERLKTKFSQEIVQDIKSKDRWFWKPHPNQKGYWDGVSETAARQKVKRRLNTTLRSRLKK